MIIRLLTEQDIPAIAALHIAVWQSAYAGIMPGNFLASMDVEERAQKWRKNFELYKNEAKRDTLIALHKDNLMGFVSYGPARDTGREDWLEIYALNIHPDYWGQGIGYALFREAKQKLLALGANQTYLWVLAKNTRALDAYSRWGGQQEDRRKTIDIGGAQLEEISIFFKL